MGILWVGVNGVTTDALELHMSRANYKYGFRQTDAICHWEVQQTQEDGRKQMVF